MMIFHPDDDFDLRLIAESGQCFRWEELPGDGCEHGQQEDDEQKDGDALVGL